MVRIKLTREVAPQLRGLVLLVEDETGVWFPSTRVRLLTTPAPALKPSSGARMYIFTHWPAPK